MNDLFQALFSGIAQLIKWFLISTGRLVYRIPIIKHFSGELAEEVSDSANAKYLSAGLIFWCPIIILAFAILLVVESVSS